MTLFYVFYVLFFVFVYKNSLEKNLIFHFNPFQDGRYKKSLPISFYLKGLLIFDVLKVTLKLETDKMHFFRLNRNIFLI